MDSMPDGRPTLSRSGRWIAPLACLAIVAWPHLGRLKVASLYSDDLVRLAHLRQMSPSGMLFRPFNEHLAPLFECVSLLCWALAGHRITATPAAFTAASLLPGLLCALALGAVLRGETRSRATGWCAFVAFGLAILPLETFWWYSASSFTWALLATLGAWWCMSRSQPGWAVGAVLASAAAPAMSAIGLLAGPLAASRGLSSHGHRRWPARLAIAALPLLGTASYVGMGLLFHHERVVADSLEHHGNNWKAAQLTLVAPAVTLLPGQLDWTDLDQQVPAAASLAAGAVVLALVVVAAVRTRGARRALVVAGAVLIYGGYALTFAARAHFWDRCELLHVQRYHLFPQAGLIAWLAAAAGPGLARLEAARPGMARFTPIALAVLLLGSHRTHYQNWTLHFRFEDQQAHLAAVGRLEEVCREQGIDRDRALRCLRPVRTPWMPVEEIHPLCFLTPGTPTGRAEVADDLVESRLLGALSPADREELCGGLDVTGRWRDAGPMDRAAPLRLVRSIHTRPAGDPVGDAMPYEVAGGPAYLEYEVDPETARDAHRLAVEVSADEACGPVELWWSASPKDWSRGRSIGWSPDSGPPTFRSIDLGDLPHWDPSRAHRLRLVVRRPGRVAIAPPRLVR